MSPQSLASLVKEHGALGAVSVLCVLLLSAIKVLWSSWHKTLKDLASARSDLDESRKRECERLYQEVMLAQAFERSVHAQVESARALMQQKEHTDETPKT